MRFEVKYKTTQGLEMLISGRGLWSNSKGCFVIMLSHWNSVDQVGAAEPQNWIGRWEWNKSVLETFCWDIQS